MPFKIRAATAALALAGLLCLGIGFGVLPASAEATSDAGATVSGAYQMDPVHTSILFKINHLGFSHFAARFDKAEGTLTYNKEAPEQSALDITIDPGSVNTNSGKLDEELRGDKWFNVLKFPRATFHATKIVRTGPVTGKITGDLTLMGMTHSVTLDATLVGTGPHPFTKKSVMGFSATGALRRSDYNLSNLLPLVGDEVTLEIETEFDKTE